MDYVYTGIGLTIIYFLWRIGSILFTVTKNQCKIAALLKNIDKKITKE